jgi:hypothetical protein
MMVGMRVEEARDFYEEDEDPTRVFALFDAADKDRTAPPKHRPSQKPDLVPLRELLRKLGTQLRQDMRELRPGDRVALLFQHIADTLGQHTKV